MILTHYARTARHLVQHLGHPWYACVQAQTPLAIPVFCSCAPWEAADEGSSPWALATRVEDLDRVPSSQLQPWPAPAVTGIEGMIRDGSPICL